MIKYRLSPSVLHSVSRYCMVGRPGNETRYCMVGRSGNVTGYCMVGRPGNETRYAIIVMVYNRVGM